MKVTLRREKNIIWIGVMPAGYVDYFWFKNVETNHDKFAELLTDKLFEDFDNHIRYDRGKLYNLGWKDAKKRNKKKTEFSGCFNEQTEEDLAW